MKSLTAPLQDKLEYMKNPGMAENKAHINPSNKAETSWAAMEFRNIEVNLPAETAKRG